MPSVGSGVGSKGSLMTLKIHQHRSDDYGYLVTGLAVKNQTELIGSRRGQWRDIELSSPARPNPRSPIDIPILRHQIESRTVRLETESKISILDERELPHHQPNGQKTKSNYRVQTFNRHGSFPLNEVTKNDPSMRTLAPSMHEESYRQSSIEKVKKRSGGATAYLLTTSQK